MRIRLLISLVLVAVSITGFEALAQGDPVSSKKQWLIYSGPGTWSASVRHMELFFEQHQVEYRRVDSKDLQSGALLSPKVRGLVMPGGESWTYLDTLGLTGGEAIRRFVADGGHYIGLCAGAFYATSLRVGGYTTGEYGIGLLDGVAYDGARLNIPNFEDGMKTIHTFVEGIPSPLQVVFLEGPIFAFTAKEKAQKKLRVLARYDDSKITRPAMLLFSYQKGRVFLSGPHPEIEEHLLGWSSRFVDPDSEWPLLKWVLDQMNAK